MTAPKQSLPEGGIHVAQRYLENLLDSDEPSSPGEIEEYSSYPPGRNEPCGNQSY
jgi:hypothetical protein